MSVNQTEIFVPTKEISIYSPSNQYSGGHLLTGYSIGNANHRQAFLFWDNKFPDSFSKASLVFTTCDETVVTGSTALPQKVSVYRVEEEWNTAMKYSTRPVIYGLPIATTSVSSYLAVYEWDVTEVIKFWKANPSKNFGICLRVDPEITTESAKTFFSSQCDKEHRKPHLEFFK
jgi:hypothetical protein